MAKKREEAKTRVIALRHVHFDGDLYVAGDTLLMAESDAAMLRDQGAVKAAPEAEAPKA